MADNLISVDEFMAKRASGAEMVVKASRAPTTWDAASRSARFVMSCEEPDRDGDIVFIDGIDIDPFKKNPVCLLNHRSDQMIGTWANVGSGLLGNRKTLEGDATLIDDDAVPLARQAAALISGGVLRASSIGFIPKTVKRIVLENGDPSYSYEISECELVECSIVAIPANPMALAKSCGDLQIARDFIEQVLDTYAKDPMTGLIVPRADYEAAHKAVSGEKSSVVMPGGLIETIKTAIRDAFHREPPRPSADEIEAARAEARKALGA